MTAWLLQALAYAALGGGVMAVNRHRPAMRKAGATLLAFSILSSASFFVLRGPDLFHLRVMREVLLITPIATMFAYLMFAGEDRRSLRIALVACLIDVGVCAAIFAHGSTGLNIRHLFGWAINVNYIVVCACTAVPGIKDVYRAWIADIERVRRLDSSAPDLDWALRNLDR